MKKVIVIGGGVVGLSIALELTECGVQVINAFDRAGDVLSASRAAGAMLGAFGEVTADDGPAEIEELDFRLAAQRYYPAWLARLQELSGMKVTQVPGTVIIANNEGVRDRDCIRRMHDEAQRRGEPAQWIEPEDVPGLKPSAARAPALCLYLGNEHAVDSGELLDAMIAALARRDAYTHLDTDVTSVKPDGDAWTATLRDGSTITADAVILANGSRALQCLDPTLVEDAGLPPLYFGKGVSCLVSGVPSVAHTIRTPNRAFACGIHVVPRPASGLLYVGATNFMGVDHESEEKVQPAELHGLFDETIHQINTDIRTSHIEQIRVGFRPIAGFRRPLVGKTRVPNLLIATGTYRNVVLMAPLVATLIAKELGLRDAAYEGNPFAVIDEARVDGWDMDRLIEVGTRDIVAFLQEPRSPLPYNRAGELETYLRSLLHAIVDDGNGESLRAMIQSRLREAPFNETLHKLFYEIVDNARAGAGEVAAS
ncbi:FAD-dependent oxidoreductase [Burkholderia ubonensis]|uniref:FAD-dependent oxidoreductase n=1 Tax=Burkholderia ubonensis subsp. mesacidophila TaxID=265293 RepID=A0A2A4FDI3_9BURK|nr:FAD-dependent oxidoreductase [Burkholderia ubonensis]PCE30730.1 FAD-dependent oxidoreductase [Burkholderia ubonensis subsp. mesacidophila]